MKNQLNKCPRCYTEFSETSCPQCQWTPEKNKEYTINYCYICNAPTKLKYKKQDLCVDCYQTELGKIENYKFTATPDQISKFLIKQGSKSIYWKHATPEQQQSALNFYKRKDNGTL